MKQIATRRLLDTLLALCVSLVGAVFIYKYSPRLTSYAWLASCAYFAVSFAAMRYITTAGGRLWHSRRFYTWSIVVVVAAMLVLLFITNPENNKVDRWSAIHNFLQHLLDGRYPYSAQTHLDGYGSVFPVWQIWHLPYYLLGNIGYSFIVCLLIFLYSLRKNFGTPVAFKALAMLAICPSFWYEVTVVSDLMPNMLLLCAFINLFNKHIGNLGNPMKPDCKTQPSARSILTCCVLCGLFLSSRMIVVIPLFYAMFWTWTRQKAVMKAAMVAIPLGVFALTFLPFVIWNSHELFFFKDNPFMLQTRQGNSFDVVVLAVTVLATVFFYRKRQPNLMSATAFTLFGFIIFVFAHRMVVSDFTLDFWSGIYDHTYLSMFIPFALTQISVTANNKP